MTRREPTSEQHQPPPFEQQPEQFHGPRIVLIGLIMLVIFVAGMAWATAIWINRSKDLEPDGPAPAREMGRRQIGIVDQVPYEQMHDAATSRAEKLKRLSSYGYVDRKTGLVHVPIERGYELAIGEQKGDKR